MISDFDIGYNYDVNVMKMITRCW